MKLSKYLFNLFQYYSKMKNKSITFFILILSFIPSYSFSQGFGKWETLYNSSGTQVEVQFKIENLSCTNNKKNKIQYRVNGTLSSFDYYLIWTSDYIDCSGKTIFQEHSLNLSIENPLSNQSNNALGDTWPSQEDEFYAQTIVTKFYDVHTSNYPSKKSGVKINLKSVEPDFIEGDNLLTYGNSTDLSVKGGSLGSGANWVWYSGSCGSNPIGKGNIIYVSPTAKTTYFVRAEGPTNKTICIEKTIQIVSKSPDVILGKTDVYAGEEVELTLSGGFLMSDATWVWYENYNKIGTGKSIKVKPTKNTEYRVRAESPQNGISNKVKTSIKVKSNDPTLITGDDIIFFGESTELTVEGGFLLPNQEYVWYESTRKIGTGKSIKVKPTKNTEYSVRAESPQNMSNKVTILIKLKSNDPTFITGDDTVFFGDSTELTVEGGFLLPNQKYVWYEEKVGGDILGKGKSIYVRPLETSFFYVRAEGGQPSGAINKIIWVQGAKVQIGKKFNPEIINIDFSNNNGKVEIKYDLINSAKSDRFIVHIDAYNKKSIPLLINSLAGDTINVKGGTSKKIIWDSKKDGYEFDEKIYFNICATSQVNIPFGAHLIKSMIFPGWGDLKLKTERKYSLLYGIAGFAFGTGAIILNQQAMQSYKSYENSFETVQSNKYYNDAVAKRNQSRILAISACLVWTVDLAGLYYKYNKIKNNLTYENCPYYYSRSHILFNSNSQLQLINTKGQ